MLPRDHFFNFNTNQNEWLKKEKERKESGTTGTTSLSRVPKSPTSRNQAFSRYPASVPYNPSIWSLIALSLNTQKSEYQFIHELLPLIQWNVISYQFLFLLITIWGYRRQTSQASRIWSYLTTSDGYLLMGPARCGQAWVGNRRLRAVRCGPKALIIGYSSDHRQLVDFACHFSTRFYTVQFSKTRILILRHHSPLTWTLARLNSSQYSRVGWKRLKRQIKRNPRRMVSLENSPDPPTVIIIV